VLPDLVAAGAVELNGSTHPPLHLGYSARIYLLDPPADGVGDAKPVRVRPSLGRPRLLLGLGVHSVWGQTMRVGVPVHLFLSTPCIPPPNLLSYRMQYP
jgi:hypothetical protein